MSSVPIGRPPALGVELVTGLAVKFKGDVTIIIEGSAGFGGSTSIGSHVGAVGNRPGTFWLPGAVGLGGAVFFICLGSTAFLP